MPATSWGEDIRDIDPVPTWPFVFLPQHFTVPSLMLRARVPVARRELDDVGETLNRGRPHRTRSSCLPDFTVPSAMRAKRGAVAGRDLGDVSRKFALPVTGLLRRNVSADRP